MINGWEDDFLRYLRFERRCSAHTLEAYATDLKQFGTYLSEQYGFSGYQEAAPVHLRSFLALGASGDTSWTARTVNRKISALQSFYRFLKQCGLVSASPASRLRMMPLPDRLPVFLEQEQSQALFTGEDPASLSFKAFTDLLICELLYRTGMRRGELQQLKEQDVEWSLGQIRVLGKGNKERLIPASGELLGLIKQYIGRKRAEIERPEPGCLLVLESGRPLYVKYIYAVVHREVSGVTSQQKRSPHVLRHSFATHLVNEGAPIQAVKELLGHSSLAATQIYAHNHIEHLKQVHQSAHPRNKPIN